MKLPESAPELVHTSPDPSGWERLKAQWPVVESLLGALVLDAIDFTDVPFVSWWYGIPASLFLGFWIASLFKFPVVTRFGLAIMAAIYFVLPGTELVPLATIAVGAARIAGMGQIASKITERPKLEK